MRPDAEAARDEVLQRAAWLKSRMLASVTMRRSSRDRLLAGRPVERDLLLVRGQHGAAMREDQRLPHPVAGDLPVEVEAADLAARVALIFLQASMMPSQVLREVVGVAAGRFTRSAL